MTNNPNEILSNILKSNAAPASEKPFGIRPEAFSSEIGRAVIDQIKTVYDPEIPVNIFDLGLIYDINPIKNEDSSYTVEITMTLTTPNCPVADTIPVMIQEAVKQTPNVSDVRVSIVFDPPWDMSMMSDEARFSLNLW
ncbi:MAG: iron-sulfur cluster assembly protein [Alphaproteobacteria bacterium]|nr:iron-sulfur cluster assembly protein [Alphaproteobacteria bacterium]MCL2505409.1 iron-sulfur cluster assembly protein [Alphaproteobacteria bacterium]